MATAGVVRASTRVAMVWPNRVGVHRDVLDLRAEPHADAELVDQAQFGEMLRLLGARDDWRYVQGEDHYLGWADIGTLGDKMTYAESYYVAILLADVREAPHPDAEVIGRLPAGARIPEIHATKQQPDGTYKPIPRRDPEGWRETPLSGQRRRTGFVAMADLVDIRQLPHRYPTADDYLKNG